MNAPVRQDGRIVGPVLQPRNLHQAKRGSIHNANVATKLGFRGGTIAGIIHHEQFAPLLLDAYGPAWFERGGISLYYLQASTHAEDVQAFADVPTGEVENSQIRLSMEQTDQGFTVLEGTACLGRPVERSYVRERFDARREPGETVILADLVAGETLDPVNVRVDMAQQDERRSVTTAPHDWYWGDSPWGGAITTPVTAFRLLNGGFSVRGLVKEAVGLYGAIEINVRQGPLFVDRDYVAQGKILATGETPKTEYCWWECHLTDPATGDEVADMLMMYRFMKGSAELLKQT